MPSKNVLLTALASAAYDTLRKRLEQRTGFPEQAADIAQESFARLAAIDNLASIGDPRAFLYTCAHHLTIDQFRRQSLLKVDTEIAFDDLPCPAPGPEERLALERRCDRLLGVLSELPPKRRHMFLLHRFEEQSYAEIAAALGISVRTVETHVRLAMAHCRKRLNVLE